MLCCDRDVFLLTVAISLWRGRRHYRTGSSSKREFPTTPGCRDDRPCASCVRRVDSAQVERSCSQGHGPSPAEYWRLPVNTLAPCDAELPHEWKSHAGKSAFH